MKQGKKPTREQRRLLMREGKEPKDWYVERDTSKKTVFVNREDKEFLFIVDKESI